MRSKLIDAEGKRRASKLVLQKFNKGDFRIELMLDQQKTEKFKGGMAASILTYCMT